MLPIRFIVLLVLLVSPLSVFAASSVERSLSSSLQRSVANVPIYLSLFADRQTIGVADSDFGTPLITGVIGWWGWPGIGLELELGKSISDDAVNNLSLEVSSLTSANLRLESPATDGIAAYALFGLSRTSMDTSFSNGVSGNKKSFFRGARAAFGLTIQATRQVVVDAAFTHHLYDEDIAINSFRLGLRYDFIEVRR